MLSKPLRSIQDQIIGSRRDASIGQSDRKDRFIVTSSDPATTLSLEEDRLLPEKVSKYSLKDESRCMVGHTVHPGYMAWVMGQGL